MFGDCIPVVQIGKYGHDGISMNYQQCNPNIKFLGGTATPQQPLVLDFAFSAQQQIKELTISYTLYLANHNPGLALPRNYIQLSDANKNYLEEIQNNYIQVPGCNMLTFDYKKSFTNLIDLDYQNFKFTMMSQVSDQIVPVGVTYLTVQLNYQCPLNCSSCDSNGICQTCLSNSQIALNPQTNLNYCKIICQSGQYPSLPDQFTQLQECKSCISYCLSCNSNQDCLACQNGYEFIAEIVSCSLKCNSNQYRDAHFQCQNCMANCLECSGPKDCKICKSPYIFDPASFQCICPKNGYFLDSNGNCSQCDPSCQSCSGSLEKTPEFQQYTQMLHLTDPNLTISYNEVIQPNITFKSINGNKPLDTTNSQELNGIILLKFPNANISQSNSNVSCIQQQQTLWSTSGCQTLKKKSINGFYCYCEKQNPTTIIDDLTQLIENKNLQTAFSSQGLKNISNFSDFYKFAIFWILSTLTIIQIGLFLYGNFLDKKYQGGIKFYKASSRVLPKEGVINQDELQKQTYVSINQLLAPQQQQTNQQQIKNQQQQSQADEDTLKKACEQIQSNPQDSLKNLELDKDSVKLSDNKKNFKVIFRNLQQDEELQSKQSAKSDNLSKILDDILNNENDKQSKKSQKSKLDKKKIFSINTESNFNTNKETAVKIASNIFNEQQNQQNTQKNSVGVDQQIFTCEMKQQNQEKQEEEKKEEENDLIIQMYMSYPIMIRIQVFHDFFSIFYLYEKVLSRQIRFTLFYIRMIHCLISGQDALSSNYRIASFFIMVAVDFLVVGAFISTLKMLITQHILNDQLDCLLQSGKTINWECPLYCSSCDNNRNCLACLNNYYKSLNPNTNLYYCKMPCPPGQYATLPDQFTQFQTCNSCIQNCQSCNSDQDCLACNNGYEFISKIVQCLLKCNSNQYRDANSQCQNCMANCQQCSGPQDCSICNNNFTFDSTSLQCICPKIGYFLDSNAKQIVLSTIQSQYPPIYRYKSLSVVYSFYVQTCDQKGPTIFIEPLNIQLQSQATPTLNQNYANFSDTQIQVDIQPYSIPISSTLDLNPNITFKNSSDNKLFRVLTTNKDAINNQAINASIVLKFPNAKISSSSSNVSCVQQQQTQWSTSGCQTLKNKIINEYQCYCEKQSPTTIIDDLNSLIDNKNLQTAFSAQGLKNLSDFSNFYKFALFWILSSLTFVQFGLFYYGYILDKKYQGGIKFYKASSRVLPIKSLNDQDEFQRQSYASINQLQILKNQQTNQQEIQNEQLQYQANEVISKKDSRQIQSQPSVSLKNFELDKDQEILAQNQTVLQAISKNNQQDDELKSKKSVKSDNLSKIVDNLINKNDNENQPSVNNFKINQKKTFSINTETNINANKETAVRIASNVLNEQMLQNKETSKKNSIVEQQILSDEMKQQNQDNQEQQKKEEEDFLAVQMYMSYPVMIRILVFHDFFSIFFLYDKLMSRSVRFTIYYIRMIHSLSISTIFSQQYNEVQMIMVSILNSVVLQISLGIIKLSYKIKKVGKYVCTFSMITLCLFYYYVILSIVSGQDSPSSNSKIASFFIIVAVDFLAFGTSVSTLKMLIASHMLNKANRFNIIMKLFSLLNLQESIENLSI
ncbi:hypothetical protein ABPG74_019924 [Tetrahymena malaccensis]